jgi:hypothetical protein
MALLLLLAACSGDAGPGDSTPADTAPAACGTWESVGQPYTLTWCSSCHSAALPEALRYGAPAGLDFDTLEGVRASLALVESASLGDAPRMPASVLTPAAEREAFGRWLACGAPGSPNPLPDGTIDERLLTSGEYRGTAVQEGNTLELTVANEGVTAFSVRLQAAGTGSVALAGYTVYDEAGAWAGEAELDPPVALWPPADGPVASAATVDEAWGGSEAVAEQAFTVTWDYDTPPDSRVPADGLVGIHVESDGGARHAWWLSPANGLLAEDHAWGPASGLLAEQVRTGGQPWTGSSDSFPVADGDNWVAMLLRLRGEGTP